MTEEKKRLACIPNTVLIFDTETSDLIKFNCPDSHPDQPWVVQLAAMLCTKDEIFASINLLIQSGGLPMSMGAFEVHKIAPELADHFGYPPGYALNLIHSLFSRADMVVCHNYRWDIRMLAIMAKRLREVSDGQSVEMLDEMKAKPFRCTMMDSTNFCKLPGKRGYKWPKLEELYQVLFNKSMHETYSAHDALEDVRATRDCYFKLLEAGLWT